MSDSPERRAAPSQVELRVIHGAQAGARLPLVRGQPYSIGSADTCSIVLSGVQVTAEHASITVDERGICVVPLQGRVATVSGDVSATDGPLPLGTVLQIGLVKLTVAAMGDEWPAEESLQQKPPADPVVQPAGPMVTQGAKVPPATRKKAPVPRLRKKSWRPTALYCVAALFACIPAIVAVQGMTLERTGAGGAPPVAASGAATVVASAPAPAPDARDLLKEVVKAFPEGTLSTELLGDGSWLVKGHVRSDAELQSLRDAIGALPIRAELRILLQDERIRALKQLADSYSVPGQLELRIQAGNADVVRIVGAAIAPEEITAMQHKATEQLALLGPVQFELMQPTQLRTLFLQQLRSAGLDGRFQVLRLEPDLALRGVLRSQDVQAWETLFLEFTRKYGSVLRISAQVDSERDLIASSITAVVVGAFPYIVTKSLERVSPGGALGGHTVISIRDGEIVLSDGLKVRYSP
jgi:type III secretion system YscD/HrpQ family protein